MKRNRIGLIAAAMAIGLGGITGTAQVVQSAPSQQNVNNEIKATAANQTRRKAKVVSEVGGLEIHQVSGGTFRSPKEYGQTFGCKKHSKKSNQLRYSHNAKVARR